jgi:hypothetical protein
MLNHKLKKCQFLWSVPKLIDFYSFGQIIVDGKRYTNDIIIFPNRIRDNWWRKEGHRIEIEDLKEVIQEEPEILVVGTGYFGFVKVSAEVKEYVKGKGIELTIQSTKDACNTFNSFKSGKKVVAALHLAC